MVASPNLPTVRCREARRKLSTRPLIYGALVVSSSAPMTVELISCAPIVPGDGEPNQETRANDNAAKWISALASCDASRTRCTDSVGIGVGLGAILIYNGSILDLHRRLSLLLTKIAHGALQG